MCVFALTASKRQTAAACAFALDEFFVCNTSALPDVGVCDECIPRTIKESVPNVSEAFLPTARVSGTLMCPPICSGGCDKGSCEGAFEGVCDGEVLTSRGSRGSRNGSSPVLEAMIIGKSYGVYTACCT
jgi:hypothetical protein